MTPFKDSTYLSARQNTYVSHSPVASGVETDDTQETCYKIEVMLFAWFCLASKAIGKAKISNIKTSQETEILTRLIIVHDRATENLRSVIIACPFLGFSTAEIHNVLLSQDVDVIDIPGFNCRCGYTKSWSKVFLSWLSRACGNSTANRPMTSTWVCQHMKFKVTTMVQSTEREP